MSSYKAWKTDLAMTKDMNRWFDEQFDKAISEIDMDSSPGCSALAVFGTTNKQIFNYKDGQVDPERVRMVKEVVRHRFDQLLKGEKQADPIKVFIKNEPHKVEKLKEERYRLISAVSLTDTIIDRILFGWLQRKALAVVGSTPCLCGWTPLQGGWRYLRAWAKGMKVLSLDKRAFDWTVQAFMRYLWEEFLIGLGVNAADWWVRLVRIRMTLLFEEAVFQFPDGEQVRQDSPGIMKSGCFLTLLLNSVAQSMLHYLAQLRLGKRPTANQPKVVGDDTIQRTFDDVHDYEAVFKQLGIFVKRPAVKTWIDFVGFTISSKQCIPAYWDKHLFKLQYAKLEDSIFSYQIIYANDPVMLKFYQQVAAELDATLVVDVTTAGAIMNGY